MQASRRRNPLCQSCSRLETAAAVWWVQEIALVIWLEIKEQLVWIERERSRVRVVTVVEDVVDSNRHERIGPGRQATAKRTADTEDKGINA